MLDLAPTTGFLLWSQHPWASWGVQVLSTPCSLVSQPWPAQAFSPELLPGDRSPPESRGEGGWDFGCLRPHPPPSAPGMTEARPPSTDCGHRVPPPNSPPPRLGPAGFLTSIQALLRGALGSEIWSLSLEGGWRDRLSVEAPQEPHLYRLRRPHPSSSRSPWPVYLKKGTEIKSGFPTLTWVGGERSGCEHQSTTTWNASPGSTSPRRACPPQRRCVTPHLKDPRKWPHLQE